jgi:3-oxoacyl-[acyl-carrier protein] reductase
VGRLVARATALPQPVELERWRPGAPVVDGAVATGAAPGGRLESAVTAALEAAGVEVVDSEREGPVKGVVFDATGIDGSERLEELYEFTHAIVRRVAPSGRFVVLATPSDRCAAPREAIAQRAIEAFVRSLAKELRAGATANLVLVEPGADDGVASPLRFLLSPKSAYVDGQVVRVGEGEATAPADWERSLEGKVALVTGAARGIGAAIASTLARDGAHVVGVDVPAASDDLRAGMDGIGGSALELDITTDDAPAAIVSHLTKEHGGVDVVVHNAGITRDVTLARMPAERWRAVLDVNLRAPERINEALLDGGTLRRGGRVVGVSSISGLAGNAGQANYAATKAGVIGMVNALAPVLAERGATINAVAPGFIETDMTARMPFVVREAGRRMNSLTQPGLPVDVAETIAWLASPGSGRLSGNVVRVCGQSLIGA